MLVGRKDWHDWLLDFGKFEKIPPMWIFAAPPVSLTLTPNENRCTICILRCKIENVHVASRYVEMCEIAHITTKEY